MDTQHEVVADKRYEKVYRFTVKSALVNAVLLVVKFVAGIVGCSYAMVADALHSTTDFLQDVMAVLYLRMGRKEKNDSHDYGYGRYATVASLFIAVILFAVGIWMAIHAIVVIVHFFSHDHDGLGRPRWIALAAALGCIIVKAALYVAATNKAKTLDSRFVSVNAHRYRYDVISSVGTALAIACATLLSSKWRVVDPMAALIVALFILRLAATTFRHAMNELLDKSLPEKTEREIADIAKGVEEVDGVLKVLTRRVGGKVAIEIVVNINGQLPLNQVHRRVVQIEDLLEQRFGDIAHMAVYVEPTPDVQNVVG